jgi:hypothetical protein
MKPIEVNIPQPVAKPRRAPLLKRLTPLGWVAVVVLGLFFCAAGALIARTIYYNSLNFDDVPTPTRFTPAPPTPTPTSLYPTATPTPEGWTVRVHPVTEEEYLIPPPEDGAAIWEAFDAVVSCYCIEDAPDDVVLEEFDRDAVLATLARLAAPHIADHCHAHQVVALTHLGPEDYVYCTDHSTCYLSRAKLGYLGDIIYNEEACRGAAPCVFRPAEGQQVDQHPCEIFSGTILYQEESGKWILSDLEIRPFQCPE